MKFICARVSIFLLTIPVLALSGCSANFGDAPSTLAITPATLSGALHGGQQPVVGATVTVYAAGSSGYGAGATAMATTTTGVGGSFQFGGTGTSYTCPASNTPMYLVATGSSTSSPANANLAMMAALGPCTSAKSASVFVDEVTTAAAILAYGQFMNTTLGAGVTPTLGATCYSSGTTVCAAGTYNQGLVNAFNTYNQLVTNATGAAVANSTSGTLTITTEAAKLNTIANVLAACVNSNGETSTSESITVCGQLFTDVNAKSAATRPYNTIQAALLMDLYPYYNVANIFALASTVSPFVGLGTAPNDWTVAISYASSAFGLNAVAADRSPNLSIDGSNRIWFPSNASSEPGIGYFDPSTTTFSSLLNFSNSGALTVNPVQLAIDNVGDAFTAADQTFSRFLSVENGTTNTAGAYYGFYTAFAVGPAGQIFYGGFSENNSQPSVGYFPGGSNNFSSGNVNFATYGTTQYEAVGLVALSDGRVMTNGQSAATGGNADNETITASGTVTSTGPLTFTAAGQAANSAGDNAVFAYPLANTVCFYNATNCVTASSSGLNAPEGVAVDGANNVWIANSGNGSVSTFGLPSPGSNTFAAVAATGYQHGSGQGGTSTTPYGIGIDASGNVWLDNINTGSFTLTEIVGAAAPAIVPLGLQIAGGVSLIGTKPTK